MDDTATGKESPVQRLVGKHTTFSGVPQTSENTPLPSYTPTVALHSPDTRHAHTAALHSKSSQPFLTGLQGSGQQQGRILVKPGSSPQEGRLQCDLHAGGPPSEVGFAVQASQTPGLRPPPPPPPPQLSCRSLHSLPGPGPASPCPLAFLAGGCRPEKGHA